MRKARKIIACTLIANFVIYSSAFGQVESYVQQFQQQMDQQVKNIEKKIDEKLGNVNKTNGSEQSSSNITYAQAKVEKQEAKTLQEKPLKKDLPKDLSSIEKMFNSNPDNILRQFGYDILNNNLNLSFSARTPENYTLSPGDAVSISLWGDTIDILAIAGSSALKPNIQTKIDSEGNLFLPAIGLIKTEGMTVSQLEKHLSTTLAVRFDGIKVKVSLLGSGVYPLTVLGNVKNPGKIYVNSQSTFLDALSTAGGISKDGSLRTITYISKENSNKPINIDLYNLFIKGSYQNIKLNAGDIIVVKPVEKVIAITEGVKRPAIYEIKQGETLKDLIGFSGGLLPSVNTNSIIIEGYDKAGASKKLTDISYNALNLIKPNDGDSISFKSAYGIAENIITVEGNIKHPGKFQYKKGMKLSDVLKTDDELLARTNITQALINRVSGTGKDIITIPVSLSKFFNKEINPELKPQDIVKIYPATQVDYIEVSGKVLNAGLVPYKKGSTLKDIIGIVGLAPNIDNNENLVTVSDNKTDNFNSSDLIVEVSNSVTNKFETIYLYDLFTKNQADLNIEIEPNDKLIFRLATEKENYKTVKIAGYVNDPGVYKIKQGMTLSELINMAGGVSEDGFLKGLVFTRPSVDEKQKETLEKTMLNLREDIALKSNQIESMRRAGENIDTNSFQNNQKELIDVLEKKAKLEYGRIVLNVTQDGISPENDLEIKDGDQIVIPSKPHYVIVTGEVLNQSTIAYIPNKNLQYYVDSVGGIKSQADKKHIYLIKANGVAQRVKKLSAVNPEKGDSIVIPRKVDIPMSWKKTIQDTLGIMFNATSTIYMMKSLNK